MLKPLLPLRRLIVLRMQKSATVALFSGGGIGIGIDIGYVACGLFYFFVPKTAHQMVIHHSGGLHVGVDDGGADEIESAFL